MPRPKLSLTDLVLRPGYVEILGHLRGEFLESGAAVPELTGALHVRKGASRHVRSVWLRHRLKTLERYGLVRYVALDPEYLKALRERRRTGKGNQASGKWILTEEGLFFWDHRLSIAYSSEIASVLKATPDARVHVPRVGTPTVAVVNTEPVLPDFVGLRELLEGPSLLLTDPARETALHEWARNPRIIADWKALQTLRKKHPRQTDAELSIPEMLSLREWHPDVRRAHRRAERHRLVLVIDMNPAYWDDLPIQRLEDLRREYVRARRFRSRVEARIRDKQGD